MKSQAVVFSDDNFISMDLGPFPTPDISNRNVGLQGLTRIANDTHVDDVDEDRDLRDDFLDMH